MSTHSVCGARGWTDGVFHPHDNCPTVDGSQTDTDGDGHGDICDCDPSDDTAFADPPEVMDLYFPDGDTLYWTTAAYAAGSGATYDVYREGGGRIPAGAGTSDRSRRENEQPRAPGTNLLANVAPVLAVHIRGGKIIEYDQSGRSHLAGPR